MPLHANEKPLIINRVLTRVENDNNILIIIDKNVIKLKIIKY